MYWVVSDYDVEKDRLQVLIDDFQTNDLFGLLYPEVLEATFGIKGSHFIQRCTVLSVQFIENNIETIMICIQLVHCGCGRVSEGNETKERS